MLNGGLLPEGFYALAEQHTGRAIPDILTLHTSPPSSEPLQYETGRGGTAVAEAPPRLRRHESVGPTAKGRRRTLAVRHVSGHRLIALFELVSPANKDRQESVDAFVDKALNSLDAGVHVAVVDLFPPGPFDPGGITGAIRRELTQYYGEPENDSEAGPLSLASYVAGPVVEIYSDDLAFGSILPGVPLFLEPRALCRAAAGIDVPGRVSRDAGVLAQCAGRKVKGPYHGKHYRSIPQGTNRVARARRLARRYPSRSDADRESSDES